MSNAELFSLSEAARRLNKRNNRKLLRFLIKVKCVPHYKLGKGMAFDQRGMKALEQAVREWEMRPRMSKPESAIAS
jgi:hypothetical protein